MTKPFRNRVLVIDDVIKITLWSLFEANEGFSADEIELLTQLEVGDTITIGGGAAAEFEIERIR